MTKTIEDKIARAPWMTEREVRAELANIPWLLERNPQDIATLRYREALEERKAHGRRREATIRVGSLMWETCDSYSYGCGGYFEGALVARVHKHANHGNVLKDVYTVEVLGIRYNERFSAVEDARKAATDLFSCPGN
ncbi:hypothetical protein [Zavarzinia aquatilis]|nr:hypothetical protein [Zavarzinia aquatilis]